MKTALAILAALLLAGCGGDHPVPERGPIVRHDHSPQMWIPTSCGKGCMTVIYYPENWSVTVRDAVNPKWEGTVNVDAAVYAKCDRPKIWPDCWKDADIR
jgi:hypothetical protein